MTLRTSGHVGVYVSVTKLAQANTHPNSMLGTQTFPVLSCVSGDLYIDFMVTGGSYLQLRSTRQGISKALRGKRPPRPLREEGCPSEDSGPSPPTIPASLKTTLLFCALFTGLPHKAWLGKSVLWLDSPPPPTAKEKVKTNWTDRH